MAGSGSTGVSGTVRGIANQYLVGGPFARLSVKADHGKDLDGILIQWRLKACWASRIGCEQAALRAAPGRTDADARRHPHFVPADTILKIGAHPGQARKVRENAGL